jgi:predicted transcriptional regulator
MVGKSQELAWKKQPSEYGVWLKKVRDSLGISQSEMARRVGLHNGSQICQLETGANQWPTPTTYEAIRAVYPICPELQSSRKIGNTGKKIRTPSEFGEWLRKKRSELNISISEMAYRTETTSSCISKLETGAILWPSVDNWQKIRDNYPDCPENRALKGSSFLQTNVVEENLHTILRRIEAKLDQLLSKQ